MIDKLLNFIDEYSLVGKTVVVAFSGGYDSMCLLDMLHKVSDVKHIKVVAAHYNHNWRGEEAKCEQDNCERFCESNGIEFYTETAESDIRKTETVARDLRYDFLERVVKKYDADAVFTAHNWDDNAETVLYRIIKGTGVVGLKGISKVRDIYYRPLLDIRRSEIEQYCSDNGLKPNRDSSNENIKYKRNLIRKEILPMLEEINPEIKKSLNSLSEIASGESDIIDEYMELLSGKIYKDGKLLAEEYKKLSKSVKKRIIYNILYDLGIEYDSAKISNIYNFLESGMVLNKPSKYSLADNCWIGINLKSKTGGTIEIIKKEEPVLDEILINDEGEYNIGKAKFTLEKCGKRQVTTDENTAFVDLSAFKNIVLRTRRDGDIIYPLGLGGKMKLKKYLNQKNLPQHKRDGLAILAVENEVLWVGGVGMSDKIKTISNPTHKLSIKYGE